MSFYHKTTADPATDQSCISKEDVPGLAWDHDEDGQAAASYRGSVDHYSVAVVLGPDCDRGAVARAYRELTLVPA